MQPHTVRPALPNLQHDNVPVEHEVAAVVELVVEYLVDNGVAVPLPHASQHLHGHHQHPAGVLQQKQKRLRVLEGGEGGRLECVCVCVCVCVRLTVGWICST